MVDMERKHKHCPQCGSTKFRLAKEKTPIAAKGLASMVPIQDRICKDCGRQYHPAMPAIIPWTFMVLGVTLVLLGVGMFFHSLMRGFRFYPWVKLAIVAAGVFCGVAGRQMLQERNETYGEEG
jgi:uncharacterized protein (DUF983 family)